MKNYHLITVKYLPATNTQGSRYKMTSGRFNESITLLYEYDLSNIAEMAERYLINNGHKVIGRCEINMDTYGIICAPDDDMTFKRLKS